MAKANTKKETKSYKEFNFTGSNGNTFVGRLWLDNAKETDKAIITPLSITINGLVIVGCKLVETEKRGNFISFPQYLGKDGEYKDLVFFTSKDDFSDLRELVESLKDK